MGQIVIPEWGATKKYIGKESGLQVACYRLSNFYIKTPLVIHVANERKTNIRRGQKLKAQGVTAGVPDLMIDEARGGYLGLRVELKTKGDKVSRAQKFMLAWYTYKGYYAAVVWNTEAYEELLTWYVSLDPTFTPFSHKGPPPNPLEI